MNEETINLQHQISIIVYFVAPAFILVQKKPSPIVTAKQDSNKR